MTKSGVRSGARNFDQLEEMWDSQRLSLLLHMEVDERNTKRITELEVRLEDRDQAIELADQEIAVLRRMTSVELTQAQTRIAKLDRIRDTQAHDIIDLVNERTELRTKIVDQIEELDTAWAEADRYRRRYMRGGLD